MTIEQAIKRAIDGGWKPLGFHTGNEENIVRHLTENWEYPVLDPGFWASLGKTMGWDRAYEQMAGTGNDAEISRIRGVRQRHWTWEWHRFIDHLADGKKPEDFFAALSLPPSDQRFEKL